jgi:predicted AlkP superfamily pyrophosphatase or phosphodiesterase
MRRWLGLIAVVAACGGEATPPPRVSARPAPATPPVPRSVVVISIDGLRWDYLDHGMHPLPNLRALRAGGAYARSMRSVWPTVTYAAHTTLVTGAAPITHGILANVAFDPFEKNEGGWYWYASDIRVPTLWDVAADARIPVANVTWPVTVGARIPYNIPQYWRAKIEEDEKLFAAITTPGLWAEVAQAAKPPGEHRGDRARADAAIHLLRTRKPGLTFVYLADLDTNQHVHGPMSPEAWHTLEETDGLVGEIVAAASEIPRLAVAIVSDHGFAPIDTEVRPNVALRRAGLLRAYTKRKDGRTEDVLASYEAVSWRSGASVAVMGREGRAEPTASRVRSLFHDLASDPASHIGAVLDGERVEREGGFPGAIVVLQAARGATFSERYDEPMVAPSVSLGMHGWGPDMPEMGCSFFLWGDGVRPGPLGDVDMIDVAPTIASLLGLTLPTAEGHPLARALQ